MTPTLDRLWEYALDRLAGDERARVERDLAASAEKRAALASIERVAAALGGSLPPVSPRAQLRERLLASISAGPARFSPFVARLSRMYELGADRIREILSAADDRSAGWVAGPIDGFSAKHFAGGPSLAGADCGLVWLEPGMHFPPHRHLGEERSLVIEGEYRDLTEDRVYRAGDESAMPANSVHEYANESRARCVVAVALHGGMEFVAGGPELAGLAARKLPER